MTAVDPKQLRIQHLPLDQLTEHPDNPRRGDLDTVKASLQTHGQYRPLLRQRSTGHIIKGNHTLQALRDLGAATAAVITLDIDDDQALQILLMDNRASDLSGYDDPALLAALESLQTLEGTGFEPADLREIRRLAGQLGQDEIDSDALRAAAQSPNHLQLNFPVTREQRDTINRALRKIQADRHLDTSTEALLALAGDIIEGAAR